MEGVSKEFCHPGKNITVGFATSMKSGIPDKFPAEKAKGETAFELQKRKKGKIYCKDI
jgi:hypothetical protein